MAWSTPGTVAAGQVYTAARYNTDTVANLQYLYDYSNQYARAKRTSGSLSSSSTTWVNLDTGLDLVLPASAGDVIEVSLVGIWDVQAATGFLDVVSVVSGNPVNSFGADGSPSNTHLGIVGWGGAISVVTFAGGNFFRTLVAGDISGGNVTLRLRRRNDVAVSKTLLATTDIPLEWWARNLGPDTG